MTKTQAETAIETAWIACLASVLVCIVTIALVVFVGMSYVYGPKPWRLSERLEVVFIKLLIVLGLGYGLYRGSRFFATALFVLFCFDHLAFLIFDAEWWSWTARTYWLFLII